MQIEIDKSNKAWVSCRTGERGATLDHFTESKSCWSLGAFQLTSQTFTLPDHRTLDLEQGTVFHLMPYCPLLQTPGDIYRGSHASLGSCLGRLPIWSWRPTPEVNHPLGFSLKGHRSLWFRILSLQQHILFSPFPVLSCQFRKEISLSTACKTPFFVHAN